MFWQTQTQTSSAQIIPDNLIETQCAWCNEENGEEQGEGSHGICDRHAEEQYSKYQESRAARRRRN